MRHCKPTANHYYGIMERYMTMTAYTHYHDYRMYLRCSLAMIEHFLTFKVSIIFDLVPIVVFHGASGLRCDCYYCPIVNVTGLTTISLFVW